MGVKIDIVAAYQRIALAMMLVAVPMGAVAVEQSDTDLEVQPPAQGMTLDLTKLFHTHSAWHFVVTEGAPVEDYGGNEAPGVLKLCLRKGPKGPCFSGPVTFSLPKNLYSDPDAWAPHYLLAAKRVYPQGPKAQPLLLVMTGSLNSGDGDQIIVAQLVAYDVERDIFRRVYGKSIGRNNNQEIRVITDGALDGSVISAEPSDRSPYGYWIVVSRPNPAGDYRQVLRYLSATRYGDGNSLAVIDSEMPNIERRLGLWKPGDPIPRPHGKSCSKPILRRTELWCN